ncbi:hypothetical protein [Cytobacillus horneckiae]
MLLIGPCAAVSTVLMLLAKLEKVDLPNAPILEKLLVNERVIPDMECIIGASGPRDNPENILENVVRTVVPKDVNPRLT